MTPPRKGRARLIGAVTGLLLAGASPWASGQERNWSSTYNYYDAV